MKYSLSTFYQSRDWAAVRSYLMQTRVNEEGYLICAHCGKPIVRSYDCIAHHTTELTEANVNNVDISLNPERLVLVHHACHNAIHEKTGCVSRTVYLVWGSPLSGKSTYVSNIIRPGDLLVDVDRIWACVSGQPEYIKPDRLRSIVLSTRDYLLDAVRMRDGKWNRAYVVGGYPYKGERERLLTSLRAQEIYIDCTQEECMARLKLCEDMRDKAAWERYVREWWRVYSPHLQS